MSIVTDFILSSYFVVVLALFYFASVRLRTLLTYFQQDEYDNKRLLGALLKVRLFDVRASLFFIFVMGILVFVVYQSQSSFYNVTFIDPYNIPGPPPLFVKIFPLVLAVGIAIIAYWESRYRFKKPLVKTQRAQTIYRLAMTLYVLGLLLSFMGKFLWVLFLLQLPALVLMLANWLLRPAQRRANQYFIDQATDKLAEVRPLTVGITGSFGKTTVKHILAELLAEKGPVFYSRGSINTILGMTRHIRRRLQVAHQFFIAEMGAYGIGSVKRLCDFAAPTYGIVTSIGAAHTERFGSVDVIAQAKSELAQHICQKGEKVVMPRALLAHVPFEQLYEAHRDKFVLVGDAAEDDVQILASGLKDGAWQVSLRLNAGEAAKDLQLTLPLLGEHNVINLALCVGLVSVIAPDILDRLQFLSPEIEQIPHRLEKKITPGGHTILDDAYNANEVGFTNAASILSQIAKEQDGRAILITPGLAELGLEHDRTHERLGSVAAQHADRVIVINPGRIPTFVAALKQAGATFDEVDNLDQARRILDGLTLTANDVVLYENDLPDLLEEKRLL